MTCWYSGYEGLDTDQGTVGLTDAGLSYWLIKPLLKPRRLSKGRYRDQTTIISGTVGF